MSDPITRIRDILAQELVSDTGADMATLFTGVAETLVVFYCSAAVAPTREGFIATVANIYDEVLAKHERRVA